MHVDVTSMELISPTASLLRANLDGANMTRANLSHTVIGDGIPGPTAPASLGRAVMRKANLEGALLKGADLRHVIGLTQEQIDSAVIDDDTRLPSELRHTQAAEG